MNNPNTIEDINKAALAAIQEEYAIINLTGKIWGLDIKRTYKSIRSGGQIAFSNRSDSSLLIQRHLKQHYPNSDINAVINEFFVSPNTTCFLGIEFNPRETTHGYINLWQGPTLIPKEGKWKLIRYFLYEVICNGDSEAYTYLIRFLAHMLQRPWEKPGIFILALGGQGVGKGSLARILQCIWSSSFKQITNMNSVTGSFNATLETAFVVFLDEAFFVGDRRASDALKSLVTEPVIHINEKHQPSRQIQSYHRFFAATNANHIKHTERDDRRDFVLRVSDRHQNDHAFWNALYQEMENGGIEALVHHLLEEDLSDFNVRDKPKTTELLSQKLLSLDLIQSWWFESLNTSIIGKESEWDNFITTDEIIEGVTKHAGKRLYKAPTAMEIAQIFKQMCPSAEKRQRIKFGTRARGFALPCIEHARLEFERYLDADIDWETLPEHASSNTKSIIRDNDDDF